MMISPEGYIESEIKGTIYITIKENIAGFRYELITQYEEI